MTRSLVVILIYACISFLVNSFRSSSNNFIIDFFNVSQGDSAAVYLNDEAYLIDGGPKYNLDQTLAKKFSRQCPFGKIFISHLHADHMTGVVRYLERCRVDEIYVYSKNDFLSTISNTNLLNGAKVIELCGEKTVKLTPDLTLYNYWPKCGYKNKNINNLSLVFLLKHKDYEVLFTGDAEIEVQEQFDYSKILKSIDGQLDVLKVPHQGSKDSLYKPLYKILEPKSVVISVGPNSYGHPSPELLDFLDEQGISVFRTDKIDYMRFAQGM